MIGWLRRFFQSRDPIVKVAAGLSEPEALMLRELLENEGVPAVAKKMNFLSAMNVTGSLGIDCDLFVKQSDAARARRMLEPLLPSDQLVPAEEDYEYADEP